MMGIFKRYIDIEMLFKIQQPRHTHILHIYVLPSSIINKDKYEVAVIVPYGSALQSSHVWWGLSCWLCHALIADEKEIFS